MQLWQDAVLPRGGKVVHIWHFVCIGAGLLTILIAVLVCKDYFFAENQYMTEATLTECNVHTRQRLRDKDDVNYSPTNKYETYYTFDMKWRFVSPVTEKKYIFTSTDQSSFESSHTIGEKKLIFIYYNGDEDNYEFMDPFGGGLVALVGLALFIYPVITIIIGLIRSRKK